MKRSKTKKKKEKEKRERKEREKGVYTKKKVTLLKGLGQKSPLEINASMVKGQIKARC